MHDDSSPSASTATNQLQKHLQLPAEWVEVNVAVALSGGADSMALLRVIQHIKAAQGGAGQLFALHVNHLLRDAESRDDAQWCQQQCSDLGIPLEVLTCDTAEYASELGIGLEAAARKQRYQLLTSAAERLGVRYLAVAHTRNDQAETVLFRILRGTGLRGLAGIPHARTLTPSLTLVRPLLGCSRTMVIEYLAEHSQPYRTDSSNVDRQFTRNRIRHDLLPLLREQSNTDLDAALVRLATQADDAQHVVEKLAENLLSAANLRVEPNSLRLRCQPFANQEPIVVCEAMRIAWRKAKLAEQAMTREWWTRLAIIVQQPGNQQVLTLPGKVRASIANEHLMLSW